MSLSFTLLSSISLPVHIRIHKHTCAKCRQIKINAPDPKIPHSPMCPELISGGKKEYDVQKATCVMEAPAKRRKKRGAGQEKRGAFGSTAAATSPSDGVGGGVASLSSFFSSVACWPSSWFLSSSSFPCSVAAAAAAGDGGMGEETKPLFNMMNVG